MMNNYRSNLRERNRRRTRSPLEPIAMLVPARPLVAELAAPERAALLPEG